MDGMDGMSREERIVKISRMLDSMEPEIIEIGNGIAPMYAFAPLCTFRGKMIWEMTNEESELVGKALGEMCAKFDGVYEEEGE